MSLHLFNLPLTLKYLILYKYIILSFEKSLIRYQNCIRMFCLFSLSSTLYLIFGESNSNMAFHFLIFIFKTMNNINIHLYFFTAICISLNVNLKFYLSLIRWNPLSTTNWHLPLALASYLCKDQIMCCCSCWFSTPPERISGWRAEMRHSVPWEN